MGIKPLATNDSHYNNPEDASAQEALLCVNSGSRLSEPTYSQGGKRFAFEGTGYYIKSAAEMRELWGSQDLMEACDNTLLVAERCNVEFTESTGGYMARADIPADETEESWLRKEVYRGLEHRYPGDRFTQEVKDRAEFELQIISQKATAATSWWLPTSSSGRRTTASGSARAVAPARARWPRTR